MIAEAVTWDAKHIAIFSIPFDLLALGAIVWLLMRRTIRTRLRMNRQLQADPDIKEWVTLFNWSRKVLYVPTIIASLVAAAVMLFKAHLPGSVPHIVGGVWVVIFFLNFLIDEFEVSIKVLLITLLFVAVLVLWLVLMDWLAPFLNAFRKLGIEMNWLFYVMLAGIFSLAIIIAWIKGMFYYTVITPNYMNIQSGPTESSEQVTREEFSTRIDTGDFLERMLGFGRIIVTFSEQHRQPMVLLVGGIGRKAELLESIRAGMTVDISQGKRTAEDDTPATK